MITAQLYGWAGVSWRSGGWRLPELLPLEDKFRDFAGRTDVELARRAGKWNTIN